MLIPLSCNYLPFQLLLMCYVVSNNGKNMIKNWTVTTRQIKKKDSGFRNYTAYLSDKNRSSHYHTDIIMLNDAKSAIFRAVQDMIQHKIDNKIRGRREPNNYATGFVLTLPRDIPQPTHAQWNEIADDAIKALSKACEIDYEKLKKLSHIVIHDESKGPKNSHVNLVVSNVVDNKLIKSMTQYKATHAVKTSLNASVRRLLGVCNTEYTPKHKNVLKQRSKPDWAARAEQADLLDKKISKAELMLDVLKKRYEHIKNDISLWAKSFLNNDELLHPITVKKAKNIANNLNDIEENTPVDPDPIDNIISDIESQNEQPLPNTKVSSNRKRRRRKPR